VAIARALAGNPPVILADEPTGNLDSHRSHEILILLQDLNRDEGITIVMVTHEDDIAAYAGRLIVFTDGRITRDEPVAWNPRMAAGRRYDPSSHPPGPALDPRNKLRSFLTILGVVIGVAR
jgi:ABC-type methionine transport system ATPase subunit